MDKRLLQFNMQKDSTYQPTEEQRRIQPSCLSHGFRNSNEDPFSSNYIRPEEMEELGVKYRTEGLLKYNSFEDEVAKAEEAVAKMTLIEYLDWVTVSKKDKEEDFFK